MTSDQQIIARFSKVPVIDLKKTKSAAESLPAGVAEIAIRNGRRSG